ncbi:MAG: glutathione S-transferase family protein [Candidatus Fonsibacter sp.]
MIKLFYYPTPNGRKISIMLEELHLDYQIKRIDITKNEQFSEYFSKISPLNKIPVIKYNEDVVIESGEILIYLAKKNNFKFYDPKYEKEINEWLMIQVSFVGPMLGQLHFFHKFNPGKSEFAENRFLDLGKKIYSYLDVRLSKFKFLACDDYTIADIATFPWLCRHEWHDIGIKNFKNLYRWYLNIAQRPAVIKGYDPENLGEKIPI